MSKRQVRRPRGRAKGVPYPETSTPALRRANRVKNLKHGRYAASMSPREARTAILAKLDPEIAELSERYAAQLEGQLTEGDPIVSRSLTESELIRRRMAQELIEKGVLVEEDVIIDGELIGTRVKANPVLESYPDFAKLLGHTATDQLLTRKARGEGAVDAMQALRLARDAKLRENTKSKMPAPPPVIETSAKKAS